MPVYKLGNKACMCHVRTSGTVDQNDSACNIVLSGVVPVGFMG